LALLSLLALAAISAPADARNCGIMAKPPAFWGMPMHHRMPYGAPKAMPYGPKYGKRMQAGPSVIAVAKHKGEFATLLTAVEAAGLTGLLEGDGPYTLFAPTDAAFKKLPEGALQELLADKAKLIALLKYHVVPGRVTAVEVLERRELDTASGQSLPTAELHVIRADIPARNGVIHVIDNVILPTG
jgi:uncharacterized surface protein with fasciclin (FAS1) repeats